MAALTKDRLSSFRVLKRDVRPLAASVKAIKGGLAVAKSGYYKPGVVETGAVVVGRFTETVDNTAGAAGAKSAEIEFFKDRVVFLLNNDGANPVVAADREASCYVIDDQTVSQLATGRSVAGKVYDVTSEGVWVEI